MSSPTAEFALYLNQQANNLIIPYIISWDRKNLKAKWHGNEKKLVSYYIFLVFWLGMVTVPISVGAIVLAYLNPGTIKLGQGMILVLSVFGIFLVFLEDYMYIFHGLDLINVFNAMIDLEHQTGSIGMARGSPQIFMKEILKLSRGQPCDHIGIGMVYFVVSYVQTFPLCIAAFIWKKVDPVYPVLRVLESETIMGSFAVQGLSTHKFGTAMRVVLCVFTWMTATPSIRTAPLFLFSGITTFVKVLRNLNNVSNVRQGISQYRNLFICFRLYTTCLKSVFSIYLSISSTIVISTTCFIVVGLSYFDHLLTAALPPCILGLGAFSFVQFAFSSCCSITEICENNFRRWKVQPGISRHTRRLIQACQPMRMRVGGVGFVDQDIKLNYSDGCLNQVIDILVAINGGLL